NSNFIKMRALLTSQLNSYSGPLLEFAESMPLRTTTQKFTGDRTANQVIFGFTPNPSKIWYLDNISVSSNVELELFFQIGSSGLSVSPNTNQGLRFIIPANGVINIPLQKYVLEGETISFTAIQAVTAATIVAGFTGYSLTND